MLSAIRIIRGCAVVLFVPPSIGHAQSMLIFGDGFELHRSDSDAEAARFLNQATFGATTQDIARVRQLGYEA
jgi:hypothetical protein